MSIPANATLKLTPFKVSLPDSSLEELKTLLKLTKLAPPTYEGTQLNLGVTRKWIEQTKARWEDVFDW
jgi:microsomal epoxide hydrolase